MALRRGKTKKGEDTQWLTVDASMTGTLTFKEPVNLRINGQFDGNLNTKGNLSIGPNAEVKANIEGEEVSVAGRLEGDVLASDLVVLFAGAQVLGNITSPRVVIQDGATIDGIISMSGQNAFFLDVQELAGYLEVDADSVIQWAKEGRLPADQINDQWRFSRRKIEEWLAQAKIK